MIHHRATPLRFAFLRFLFAVMSAAMTASMARADDPWIEIRTPNFTLISNASQSEAQRTAYELELIRAALGRATGRIRPASAPSLLIWTNDKKVIQRLLPPDRDRDARVITHAGPEKYYAAIKDIRRPIYGSERFREDYGEVNAILTQVYAHRIVDLQYGMLPPWMESGLGSLFGNTVFRANEVRVGTGTFLGMFLRQGKLLPLEKFVTIDRTALRGMEESKASLYWAQSWAVIHFLFFARDLPVRQPAERILDRLYDGVAPQQAAEEVLGDLKVAHKQFEKYIRQPALMAMVFPPSPTINIAQIPVRQMAPAEVAAAMADFLLTGGRPKDARPFLEEALKLNGTFQPAQAAMGWLLFKNGERDAAVGWLEKAIATAPGDYLAQYYLASALASDPQKDPQALRRAEAYVRQAISLAPHFAPSYEGLARVLLELKADPVETYASAGYALERDGSVPGFYLTFAKAALRHGANDVAREAARRVLIGGRAEKELTEAKALLDSLGAPATPSHPPADPATSALATSEPRQTSPATSAQPVAQERPHLKRRSESQRPSQRPTVEGIAAASCRGFEMDLQLKVIDETVRLRSGNVLVVEYYGWPKSPERFNPCAALAGARVKVTHENGEIFTVDLLK